MAVTVATSAPVTEAVASYVADADFSRFPNELLHRATRAFIDTIGVAIAARREPSFTILAHTIGTETESGVATVLATRTRTSAAQAAFLNGTAGHALDFDDVADEITGHPSVVLVPTLLALAESERKSGRELLEAYVVGFETACAIARGLPIGPHYSRGWHATATVGILGAAAGACRLLGLSEANTRNALGIAASMAGGSRQNFGTMTKPLHAGLVSRDALLAAQLAGNGFTADQHQLEGPLGYFALYGVDSDPRQVLEALEHPSVLLERGLNVKKFACCYQTHRMADAALALYSRGLRADEIRSIDISVEPGGMRAIIHHRPETGLEGKFSGEYVVSACLLDGAIHLSTFTDEAVARREAQDLLRRITVREDAVLPFGPTEFDHSYATLQVTLADGNTLRERCDVPRGDARMPLSDSELETKFRDCLDYSGTDWDADVALESLWRLASLDGVADALS